MLAAGTCQDGNLCGGAYSQCQKNTINNTSLGLAEAVASKYSSTAYKMFPSGTHTVLLRHNNYMGCGGTESDCLGSAPIAFTVETGAYEQMYYCRCKEGQQRAPETAPVSTCVLHADVSTIQIKTLTICKVPPVSLSK
jgi:hypothetical protein